MLKKFLLNFITFIILALGVSMPTYATTLNDIKNNSLAHCELQDLEQPNKTYDVYLVGNDVELRPDFGGDDDCIGAYGDLIWVGKSFSLIYTIKGSNEYDTYQLNGLFPLSETYFLPDYKDYYLLNTTRGFQVSQDNILSIYQATAGSSGECVTTYAIINGELKQIPYLQKDGNLIYRPGMIRIIDYKWGAYIIRKIEVSDWTRTLEAYTYDPQSQQLVWKKTLAIYDGEKQIYLD